MHDSNAFAIEVQGRPAGVVVAERGGFTFFVADQAFRELDGRFFRRVEQAERAARQLAAARRRSSAS